LAKFLGCGLDELFPECVLAVKKTEIVAELAESEVRVLSGFKATLELPLNPEELLEEKEVVEFIRNAVDELPEKSKFAITGFMNDQTAKEISEGLQKNPKSNYSGENKLKSEWFVEDNGTSTTIIHQATFKGLNILRKNYYLKLTHNFIISK
jgi:hypothetical protein